MALSEAERSRAKRSGLPSPMAEGEPFLRGLVGAITLLLVARAVEPLFFGDAFYATLAIHPFWIFVMLAAVQSGFFVGVTTAAAAAMLMDWPPRPIGVDITAHYVELAIVPVQWLLAAIVIGGYRQGQIRRQARLAAENVRLWRMSEDLAAELDRTDDMIAELELHAATGKGGAAGVGMRPDGDHGGEIGDARAGEPGLAALAALAMARPDAFRGRFAEAAAALGFAGAAFHAPRAVPVLAGLAPDLTMLQTEKLRQQVSEAHIVDIEMADGRQIVIGVGDHGLVATMTPRRGSAADEADQGEGKDESAAPADATSAAFAAEAIARTAALAAAVGFSSFRPTTHLTPVLEDGTWRQSARQAVRS